MKTYEKCLSCFERQAADACAICGLSEQKKKTVLHAVRTMIHSFPRSHSPVEMAVEIHEVVRSVAEIDDPYSEIKLQTNRVCRECVPMLAETMVWSLNHLATASKLSIAGNLLDFGAYKPVRLLRRDISRIVHDVLAAPLIGDPIGELERVVRRAGRVLFLADNAGECFFDGFLLNCIHAEKVTYAVRGGPVLNDATVDDARAAGIDKICGVIDTGDNAPGVLLDRCSPAFRTAFEKSDVVIAKGQGNYESLSGINGRALIFLTKVKCDVIARDIGYPVGSNVVKIQGAN